MTDIATPVQMPATIECQPPVEGMSIWLMPDTEPDAEPPVARAVATLVTGPAMPVTQCGCCGATIGPMQPNEVNCPRRHRG